jgi:Type VI secretion system/phage-baseplate injector OB domain
MADQNPQPTNGQPAAVPHFQRPGISRSTLPEPDAPTRTRYFGKYRGTVVNGFDPTGEGKIQVNVPGISMMNWATPCVPFADVLMGSFVMPRPGANIWVEFEKGDPDLPIWVGSWWGTIHTTGTMSQMLVPDAPAMTFETLTAGIGISDVPLAAAIPGNVVIQAAKGAVSITLNPAGVTITAPLVQINAPAVSIKTGHFSVAAPNFTVP